MYVLTVITFQQMPFDAVKDGPERFKEVTLHQSYFYRVEFQNRTYRLV